MAEETLLRTECTDSRSSDSVILNVAAMPPGSVASVIYETGARLGGRGGMFKIDGRERYAHLTLYMARFPVDEMAAVKKRISTLAGTLSPVRATHAGYFLTPGNYYEVSYRRDDGLLGLHNSVMTALHDLRYSPGNPVVEEYFAPYTADQRAGARRWGYDLADGLYRPHITITRFRSPVPDDVPEPGQDLSFDITDVGLFEADDMGAARRLVESYPIA